MKLSDPYKIAYQALSASRLRFFLTVLGIVIGVASVILVMSAGASAQQLILGQVESVGSNLLAVLPGASEENGPPAMAFGIVSKTLVNGDLEALQDGKNIPEIIAAVGYVTGTAIAESDSENIIASYQGVSASLPDVESVKVESGRFFFSEEDTRLAHIAVLGGGVAEKLFPNGDSIGKVVTMKRIPFTVVGVLKKRGSGAFSNTDDVIHIPLDTAQKELLGIKYLNYMRAKVSQKGDINQVKADVYRLLDQRHRIDPGQESDFSVRSLESALDIIRSLTNVLKFFLVSIAAISLLVGGIGIMNSMLIAVNARIREIGLRKAVGARPSEILFQFLLESIIITLLGGLIGIAIGVSFAYVASLVIPKLGYDWQFLVPLSSVWVSFGVCFVIGMVFGLYPAQKASKVSPMEALRYE
ncbi:MAG: ABC transporter permease [Candidatus Moranbacteria bacterium]|jgi:putative ABC transport system permease protein|nr:ABC transporter permease [Candidatus Moranbacteria bacterium]MBP9801750.1 ABC transporter permease [Candidatus Moranbacteria bacterium]